MLNKMGVNALMSIIKKKTLNLFGKNFRQRNESSEKENRERLKFSFATYNRKLCFYASSNNDAVKWKGSKKTAQNN